MNETNISNYIYHCFLLPFSEYEFLDDHFLNKSLQLYVIFFKKSVSQTTLKSITLLCVF